MTRIGKQRKPKGFKKPSLKKFSDEELFNELQRRKPEWTPFEQRKVTITGNTSYHGGDEIWVNSRYQVLIYNADNPCKRGDWNEKETDDFPRFIQLSIKNHERAITAHDWRDMMRIKNELIGRNAEALELYPSMNRITDEANQFHLWVMIPKEEGGDWPQIPVGWKQKLISNPSEAKRLGGRQRKFEEGFLNEGDIEAMHKLAEMTKKLDLKQE